MDNPLKKIKCQAQTQVQKEEKLNLTLELEFELSYFPNHQSLRRGSGHALFDIRQSLHLVGSRENPLDHLMIFRRTPNVIVSFPWDFVINGFSLR